MQGVETAMLACILGQLGLALVALVRAERKDIPEVVRELTAWWRRWTWHRHGLYEIDGVGKDRVTVTPPARCGRNRPPRCRLSGR
jgi:hypothetical protein